MADDLGAVRRTPRPTGDRQTPETVAQLPRGATNTASAPVDAETTAGNGTGDLRAKFLDTFLRVTRDTADGAVMAERFIAEGWRPAQPSDGPLAIHFAGPYVTIGGRRRQLCAWCGHVLLDVQLAPGQEHEPWFDVKLVRVEDGATTRQPYTYGDPLPPGCCALPDDEQYARTASSGPAAQGIPAETESTVDGCTCSPDRCDRLTVNGQCQHCARLGPGEGSCPAEPWCDEHGHPALTCTYCDTTGEIDESGPDEAQETRAADWPAEEVTRG